MRSKLRWSKTREQRALLQARHQKNAVERETKEKENLRQQLQAEKAKNVRLEKLLLIAKAKSVEYRAAHPDWAPAEQTILQKADDEDARIIYTVTIVPTLTVCDSDILCRASIMKGSKQDIRRRGPNEIRSDWDYGNLLGRARTHAEQKTQTNKMASTGTHIHEHVCFQVPCRPTCKCVYCIGVGADVLHVV